VRFSGVTQSRTFWPLTVLLLALMGTLQVTTAWQETQTYDEGAYLAAGYSYLKTGDYRMNAEHPPLAKLLAGVALLPLKPRVPLGEESWKAVDQYQFGSVFLYRNRVPAERMLFHARCVTILLTLCLGLAVAVWARRHFGTSVALLAVLLFALDPNFIAHGHYVTNDLHLALFVFLGCASWGAFLATGWRRDLLWAGVAAGLALLSKFSGVLLFPIFVVLYAVAWWQQGRRTAGENAVLKRLSLGHLLGSLLAVSAVSVVMIALAYAPETRSQIARDTSLSTPPLLGGAEVTPAGKALYQAGQYVHLPVTTWLRGLEYQWRHNERGHPAYLLGKASDHGRWYYFPVVFAVKTPTAVLLLVVLCVLLVVPLLFRWSPLGVLRELRRLPLEWFVLFVPMSACFAVAMMSKINIGVRHILPVYPFLFILVAAIVLRSRWGWLRRGLPVVLCAVALLETAESAMVYPHYLAFFNSVSGGPGNGSTYLVDSNLDWGQDLRRLRDWRQAHGNPPLCLAYFGSADRAYYGLPAKELPPTWDTESRSYQDCIAAVSVTFLKDVYVKPGYFQWLREMQPMGRVGYSIYLYDLRKRK